MAFARGVELPPLGSVEDRVIREVVYRERMEKVAHVRAIAGIFAQMMSMDTDRAFGSIIADYAAECFQESYDPDALRKKAENLRAAQAKIRAKRERDRRMVQRLERLGEYVDQKKQKK